MGKILIVEYNKLICNKLKDIISSLNMKQEIITTGFASEALKYAKNEKIDIFILDNQVIDNSGIELAKEIRKMDYYSVTPIIFITSVLTKDIKQLNEIHSYNYIMKPIKVQTVKQIITEMISYNMNKVEQQKKIILKQKKHEISIYHRDIIYIEFNQNKLHIITMNEEFSIKDYTLSEIEEELSSSFIRCDKYLIVNKNFIKKIDKIKHLVLTLDESIIF